MSSSSDRSGRSLKARVAGQGALLLSGYALSQIFSFARNAIFAHWLAKGDFGIAAAILLLLQMLETLSDLGADRLIVQAPDGDAPRLVATAHATLVIRGVVTAVLLLALSGPMAHFFHASEAHIAFALAAAVPLIKGVLHLDSRIAQRRLDNRPQMLIEALPQAIALLLTLPAIWLAGGYMAVLAVAILQAVLAVALSHILAANTYRIGLDHGHLKRLVAFGWPIWASAFPLIAVYQGDRMLVGRMAGMEELAAYTAAFMVTMVPGLLAAKVANALMLPLLASERERPDSFVARYRMMAEATAIASALYLVIFLVAGGTLLAVAFGPNYAGLGPLVGWLALMWSMRMLQAVPGAALLARGTTKPFFAAGMIRATGLAFAYGALVGGYGLAGAAAAGAFAEFLSLAYVVWRLDALTRAETGGPQRLGSIVALRSAFLLPAVALGLAAATWPEGSQSLAATIALTFGVSLAVLVLAVLSMGEARRQVLLLAGTGKT